MYWFQNVQAELKEYKTNICYSPEEFKFNYERRASELSDKFGKISGTNVLILKNNSLQFLIDLFAVWCCGAVAVPLMPSLSQNEKNRLISFCSPSMILDQSGDYFVSLGATEVELEGVALLLFTSGTTGEPKGVKISHTALGLKISTLGKYIRPEEIKNTFCALPTYFGHGLICNTLFPMFYARKFIIVEQFGFEFVSQIVEFINQEEISFFSTVPSVWDLVLNLNDEKPTLKSLKRVHCASSTLNSEKNKKIYNWVEPARLFDVYGITEMLGWIGEREIFKENFKVASKFEKFWDLEFVIIEEELKVKSKYMFSGYYKSSGQVGFDHMGFFETGDLFNDGFLVARKKEVVIKSGFKVYLVDIDSLVLNSSLVEDACAYGFGDEFAGERLGLALVLKNEYDLEVIKKYFASNVSTFKIPDEYLVLSKLPRNERGKINRKFFLELRKKSGS